MMPFPFSVRFYLHIYSAVTFRRRIKMRRRPAGAVARKFESGREGRTYYWSYRAWQNAGMNWITMMVSMMNWWTTPKTRRKAGGWERHVSPRETIIGIGIGIGIQTEKTGYNPTITPYHDQPLYSLQCHDLTACRARCIRILQLLLDFELRTWKKPKNFFSRILVPRPRE